MLSVHTFCVLCTPQDLYPIGRRCNSTFCVPSAMVSTCETTDKMLQSTVHRGLILQKVSTNDKDN